MENGCKWRSLPKEYGDWHVIYVRVNRWAKIAILKRHFCVYNSWDGVILSLSAGNCGDGPQGRALLRKLGPADYPVCLLMDRAYEGDKTKALAAEPD